MKVRKLRWLRSSVAAAFSSQIKASISAWSEGWGVSIRLDACLPAAECQDLERYQWQAKHAPDGQSFWWYATPEFDGALCRALFLEGGFSTSDVNTSLLASSVVVDAREDLIKACLAGLRPTTEPVQTETDLLLSRQFRPSAGALVLRLDLDGHTLNMLLPVPLLPERPRAQRLKPELHGVISLVKNRRLPITLYAGATELTVQHLHNLRLGDVLTLSARIDNPLHVAGPNKLPLCRAYLGRTGSFKAIELSKEEK